jgi:hypothetical protein
MPNQKQQKSASPEPRHLRLKFQPAVLFFLLFFPTSISLLTDVSIERRPAIFSDVSSSTPTPPNASNRTAGSKAANPNTPQPDGTETGLVDLGAEQNTPENSLPIFDQFIQDLKNDRKDQVVGLWVENVMALRVIYQPSTKPGFVSTEDETATYFLYPWNKAGNHGLLAHNYLAGRYFFNVKVGDVVTLIFGDGNYEDFEVTEVKEFQALQPDSPYSDYIDLVSGEQMTVSNVFIEIYMGDFHTTLQTCIANGAETEWGRHFTIAPPMD